MVHQLHHTWLDRADHHRREYHHLPYAGEPEDIVTGPDQNLWISNISGAGGAFDSIARLTPSGRFTYFTVPNKDEAWDITNGPGGLWFTDIQGEVGGGGAIGLITAR